MIGPVGEAEFQAVRLVLADNGKKHWLPFECWFFVFLHVSVFIGRLSKPAIVVSTSAP